MNVADNYHVGIVVDDLDATLAWMTETAGYQWCDEFKGDVPVRTPKGESVVSMRFAYSMNAPRLEIIQQAPGTVWEPTTSGLHHLGYWSDDVAGDAAALEQQGAAMEVQGLTPDGGLMWSYHKGSIGPRIELVSRAALPLMEQWWATGKMPTL